MHNEQYNYPSNDKQYQYFHKIGPCKWFGSKHMQKSLLHVMVDSVMAETFYPVKSDHFALYDAQNLNRFLRSAQFTPKWDRVIGPSWFDYIGFYFSVFTDDYFLEFSKRKLAL